jgi:hypothetical protein
MSRPKHQGGKVAAPCPPNVKALLGTLPDKEVAAKTGQSHQKVRAWRIEANIPFPQKHTRPCPTLIAVRLGTCPDKELARLYRYPKAHIRQWRTEAGIPPYVEGAPLKVAALSETQLALREVVFPHLGVLPDTEVAQMFGLSVGYVRTLRRLKEMEGSEIPPTP